MTDLATLSAAYAIGCMMGRYGSSARYVDQFHSFCGDIMNTTVKKTFTKAELPTQALEMLAIGNVAVHRAQERNRALGIANYYPVAGRIVTDAQQQRPVVALSSAQQ
ncbi:MAG: hypothetical protein K9K38_15945 [Rhodoferax sp.]|nr:hypothetical protein [Rhodoferax sp.]